MRTFLFRLRGIIAIILLSLLFSQIAAQNVLWYHLPNFCAYFSDTDHVLHVNQQTKLSPYEQILNDEYIWTFINKKGKIYIYNKKYGFDYPLLNESWKEKEKTDYLCTWVSKSGVKYKFEKTLIGDENKLVNRRIEVKRILQTPVQYANNENSTNTNNPVLSEDIIISPTDSNGNLIESEATWYNISTQLTNGSGEKAWYYLPALQRNSDLYTYLDADKINKDVLMLPRFRWAFVKGKNNRIKLLNGSKQSIYESDDLIISCFSGYYSIKNGSGYLLKVSLVGYTDLAWSTTQERRLLSIQKIGTNNDVREFEKRMASDSIRALKSKEVELVNYFQALSSRYGEKYVNMIREGHLAVGMPFSLLKEKIPYKIGVDGDAFCQNKAFKFLSYPISCRITSDYGDSQDYNVNGYLLSPSYCRITVTNGRISSIHYDYY